MKLLSGILLSVVLVFVLVACADVQGGEPRTQAGSPDLESLFAGFDPDVFAPPPAVENPEVWADSMLSTLTLRERVGQLFVVRHQYTRSGRLSKKTKSDIALGVGGVLVSRLLAPDRVKLETSQMQELAEIPLLVAADYERGVGRFTNTFTELPSNMAIGATHNTMYAGAAGRLTAIEARSVGVNWLFAPVVDVNNNPLNPIINIRSYGSNPDNVAAMASAFAVEAERYGVLTTAKHFPGHGNISVDTHSSMGQLHSSREEMEEVELFPFRKLLDANEVGAVMTAHLWAKAFDPQAVPATLSEELLRKYLRVELGFDGIIITDDIRMGGVTKTYSFEDRILGALKAGVDVILMPDDLAEAIDLVVQKVEEGEIGLKQINKSVRRILLAKSRLHLQSNNEMYGRWYDELAQKPLGQTIADEIAAQSITLVKTARRNNGDSILFSQLGKGGVCLYQFSNYRNSESVGAAMDQFAESLRRRTTVRETRFAMGRRTVSNTCGPETSRVVALYLRLRSGRGSAGLTARSRDEVQRLMKSEAGGTLVVFGSPYAITEFADEFDNILIAYDQTIASVSAMFDILLESTEAPGIIPVSLN